MSEQTPTPLPPRPDDATPTPAKSAANAAEREHRSVSRAAFRMGAGGLFSLVAGFASQMVIAALFGVGEAMDAYITALAVPIYAQAVLLAGLSFAFIPTYIQSMEEGDEEGAWRLIGTFFWLIGGMLLLVSLAVSFFAGSIIDLIAPGLTPDKAQLAAAMLSVLAFSVVLNGYAVYTTGIQNARNQFFWPAFGGAVNSVVNIVVLLALYRFLGPMALAWSFLAATAGQAIVTVTPVVRHGWTRPFGVTDARVRQILVLMAPFVLLGLVTRVTPILQRYFASGLPDGDLSYLGYATKLARIFQSLLGATIVTAIFPILSRRFARDGLPALFSTYKYGLRLTAAVAFPVVVIVSALAVPLIAVIFERGAFDHTATLHVARVLPVNMLSAILLTMIGNLLTRVFYVTKDTRSAPLISAATVLLYVPAAYFGVQWFGYVGLAWADVVYGAVGTAALFGLLIYRYGDQAMRMGPVLAYGARYLAPTAVAGLVAVLLSQALASYGPLVQLVVAGPSAALLYVAVLYPLDRTIAQAVVDMVGGSLLRKLPGGHSLMRRFGGVAGRPVQ